MPDTSALGWLSTLQGEEGIRCESLRRERREAEDRIKEIDHQIAWHEERYRWLGEAIDAMSDGLDGS